MKANSVLVNHNNGKRYQINDIIGSGSYGQIYKATEQLEEECNPSSSSFVKPPIAIKSLQFTDDQEGLSISTLREVKALKELKGHPNILSLEDIFEDPSALYLCLEYVPHDFAGLICDKQNVHFHQGQIKDYMYQLLSAVAHVHEKGYIHCDMKSANVLVSENGEVKLADFGLAVKMAGKSKKDLNVVTRWYRAPEILLGDAYYTSAVDMWAVGCILFEFINRNPILPGTSGKNQLDMIFSLLGVPTDRDHYLSSLPFFRHYKHDHVNVSQLKSKIEGKNSHVKDLLYRLLALDPRERITAKQALSHSWFMVDPKPSRELRYNHKNRILYGKLPSLPHNISLANRILKERTSSIPSLSSSSSSSCAQSRNNNSRSSSSSMKYCTTNNNHNNNNHNNNNNNNNSSGCKRKRNYIEKYRKRVCHH